ncbi:MAG: hypothetical protein KC609_19385 [Myxococcales bacterium]|nr:hypothetical protein [Myxococcales bacterium]
MKPQTITALSILLACIVVCAGPGCRFQDESRPGRFDRPSGLDRPRRPGRERPRPAPESPRRTFDLAPSGVSDCRPRAPIYPIVWDAAIEPPGRGSCRLLRDTRQSRDHHYTWSYRYRQRRVDAERTNHRLGERVDQHLSLELDDRGRPSGLSADEGGEETFRKRVRYDADGRIVEVQSWSVHTGETRFRQVWDGDRLWLRESVEPEQRTQIRWRYDGNGDLVAASYRRESSSGGVTTAESRWSYDAQRRLVSWVREHDGLLVLRVRWSWGSDDRLRQREVQLVPSRLGAWVQLQQRVPDGARLLIPASFDEHQNFALPHRDATHGCTIPPIDLGSPYAETIYRFDLGLEPTRYVLGLFRPPSANPYMQPQWPLVFAHVAPLLASENGIWLVERRLTYDPEGRMVRELAWTSALDPRARGPEPPLALLRRRTFLGDELQRDRVVWHSGPFDSREIARLERDDAQDGRETRILVFGYDSRGRLIRRERRQGGALLERHSYEREPGRVIVRIEGQPLAYFTRIADPRASESRPPNPLPLTEWASFELRTDRQGRLLRESIANGLDGQTESFRYQRCRYSDPTLAPPCADSPSLGLATRLAVFRRHDLGDERLILRQDWDSRDELLASWSWTPTDGALTTFFRGSYNRFGLSTSSETNYPTLGERFIERRVYSCR